MEDEQNFTWQHIWARGYYVNMVGSDEQAIAEYIQNQKKVDIQENCQLGL